MGVPSDTCGVRKGAEADVSTSSSPVSNHVCVTLWARFQGYDMCVNVVSAHQQCVALHNLSSLSKDNGGRVRGSEGSCFKNGLAIWWSSSWSLNDLGLRVARLCAARVGWERRNITKCECAFTSSSPINKLNLDIAQQETQLISCRPKAMDAATVMQRHVPNTGQVHQRTNLNRLCVLCEGLCVDRNKILSGDRLQFHHKSLEALRVSAKDGCHLCTLMLSALRWRSTPTADGALQYEEVTVGVDWKHYGGTQQTLLVVSCCDQETELVFEHYYFGRLISVRSRDEVGGPLLGSRAEHGVPTWGRKDEYLQSADIESDPSSARIFSQITSWLQKCSTTHQKCHHKEAGTPLLPTRVVDVGPPDGTRRPCLKITSGMEGDYIALSHCWGRAPMFKTTLSELDSRVNGISMRFLPRNFQDAVKITRKLHMRYLWIDSLCIIQDSTSDWEQESAQMGKYYANAWLTISADAALDSHGGILNERNILEFSACEHPRLVRDPEEGRLIYPNIGSFIQNVQEGILSRRGWTLQERVLSRRVLHWCRYELYWECTELQASERRPEGVEQNLWEGHHITQLLRNSQTSHSRVAASATQMFADLESQSTSDLSQPVYKLRRRPLHEAYKFWYELLEDFCKRDLTVKTDKLPAISGLANSFANLFLSDPGPIHGYVAGLWATDLPIGLAWRAYLQETSRQVDETRFFSFVNRNHRVPFYRAPSFSWASTDGPIIHPYLDALKEGQIPIPSFEPDVLDVQVTRCAGADPFGQVIGGRVKLRGHIKAFKDPPEGTLLYIDESPEMDMSRVRSAFERWSHLHCLCLGVVIYDDTDPRTTAFCLVLEATGEEQGEYRRVGLLEEVKFMYFEDCARSVISLV